MMQRAQTITGPYTETRQLTRGDRPNHEPNQGGLVQTEKGDWFFFTHHGTGAWEGRCASLLPVTWIDGWPVIGEVGPGGLGGMVWSGRKPVNGLALRTPQSSDDFSAAALSPQWEWNYQPRADKWSLTERPGHLRLKAFKPLRPDDLKTAGNTLTQRTLRAADSVATVALDLTGLAEGQVAGLCHFAKDSSRLGVRRSADGTTHLEFAHDQKILVGPVITTPRIQLRSSWGLDGLATYAFSVDEGRTFTPFGEPYQFTWGNYRGTRIGLFTYNNTAEQGHVDIDWFTYTYSSGPLGTPSSSSARSGEEKTAPK
jgi:beta-xylosidase